MSSAIKTAGGSFVNIRNEGLTTTTFQLVNTHVTYANTLRRCILSEVKTVGFRAEILKDGSTSDVKILKNTTAMSNEMLAHRIGLIPIHADAETWNPDKYTFELKVENNTDKPLDVTVSDIEVHEIRDGEPIKVKNVDFFQPNLITGDTCLLAVLKPKVGNATPEVVAFTAKATVGTGRENVRFSPTSQCSYSYTRNPDPEKIKEVFVDWLNRHKKVNYIDLESDSERKALYEREFNTMEIARCYLKNAKGEPYSFDFTIETAGIMKPFDIVIAALKVLQEKCVAYANFHNVLPTNVNIQLTKKEARGFDIYFQKEDHTLGNLLTTWMDENMLDPNAIKEDHISYCGYCVPHPLRDEMLMTIIAPSDIVCRKVIAAAASGCGDMFRTWLQNLGTQR